GVAWNGVGATPRYCGAVATGAFRPYIGPFERGTPGDANELRFTIPAFAWNVCTGARPPSACADCGRANCCAWRSPRSVIGARVTSSAGMCGSDGAGPRPRPTVGCAATCPPTLGCAGTYGFVCAAIAGTCDPVTRRDPTAGANKS